MKKLAITELLKYRKDSEYKQKKFVQQLKSNELETSRSSGGHYWIRSLSAVRNTFVNSDCTFIKSKIDDILIAYETTTQSQTKQMYDRNLQVLYNYEDANFDELKPSVDVKFLEKEPKRVSLEIEGFHIKVNINELFEFKEDNIKKLGAICFVSKLDGYSESELGMFSEVLYKYLNENYSTEYNVDPKFVWALDVFSQNAINYQMLEKNEVNSILEPTLNNLKSMIK